MSNIADVAERSAQDALLPFTLAVVMLLMTAMFILWTRSAKRAHESSTGVLFARSPWPLVAGALIFALCMVALGVIGIVPSSGIFLLIVFIALFDLVFYGQFFMPSLVFYVADTQGLTRQWLNTKKTLPWYAIDWIYGARKTTSYRTYGVKTGQSREESLMVEAGATRSMKITLRAWLVGGDPNPLLTAIEGRASNALVGFDKMPIVEQRRAAGVLPGAR